MTNSGWPVSFDAVHARYRITTILNSATAALRFPMTGRLYLPLALFLFATSSWIFGPGAAAQESGKTWKVGVLVSTSATSNRARDEALRDALRSHGYVEGKNLAIEFKYAEGNTDNLPQLARALVEQKPDVIVAGGTAVAVAAKNATKTIPIVVAGAGDLVEAGLIKSFMFPGGNVTGVARLSPDFFDARLKLVREVLPNAKRVAALANPANPGHERTLKDVELSAKAAGMTFESVAAKTPADLDTAIARAGKGGANVLFILTDALFNSHLSRMAQAAVKSKLPAVYDRTDFVEAGGFMSYGVNLAELSARAADYVAEILKGAKPGDLTLIQPTKFDLAINLQTANQVGVKVPPDVVGRAVKIIK